MTIFLQELKKNRLALIIWSCAVALLLAMTAALYPIIKVELENMEDMFAGLGDLSGALGFDQLQNGGFLGYFATECSEALGLGGAIFAALMTVGTLAGEEHSHTAEFLLTHPISRTRVVTERALAVLTELIVFNLAAVLSTTIAVGIIAEEVDAAKLALIFLSAFILQVEFAAVCLLISSFAVKGGTGIALGVTIGAYFINLIGSVSEETEILKYLTPYSLLDGTYINENAALELKYLPVIIIVTLTSVVLTYLWYNKKDIK